MKSIVRLLPLLGVVVALPAQDALSARATGSLETWLASESPIALRGILNNIGAQGSKVQGAFPGIVVASPSRNEPPYFYTWTRDAALTIKCLVDQFQAELNTDTDLEGIIQDYINSQVALQLVSNPSGGLCDGGLGEPKFNVDLTAFTGNWGRPQRDGPALRATAMIAYAKVLISQGKTSQVTDIIWPVILNDLGYVTQYWNRTGFDLWEEVNSASFFTTASQYRALAEGSALAARIGQTCPHCDSQAPQILCFLQSYWTGSYALSNTGGGRTGKDVNSILTSIHMFDSETGCNADTFQPCSDRALANHKQVTDSFRSVYDINGGIPQGQGVAVGRYAEDVYMQGNPWYLANFAAAEQLYDAVHQWSKSGSIDITPISLAFFQDVYPEASVGSYASSSAEFEPILSAVKAYADTFFAVAQKYTPENGALAEQFSRADGAPLSAVDLTWSYAAFLTALNARRDIMPAAWGAGAAQLPSNCQPSSANGPCAAATNTFSRPGSTPTATTTSSACSATPTLTNVLFEEIATTNFGENIFIVGSSPELGSWNTEDAVALSAERYTASNPLWSVTISLSSGSSIEYKYIRNQPNGGIRWESDPDRTYMVPVNCAGSATQRDVWR